MKVALIMDPQRRSDVMNQKAIDYFASLGELSLNDGDNSAESVKKALAGADIAITSWGNTTLDADILSVCPDLKLVAHAAGSVKPIVSDALWDKGIRVISGACPLGEGVAETALGFTLSASKNFYLCNNEIHGGGWNKERDNVRELFDLNIGVIGCGWAGKHYIKLLQNFYVDVYCADPFVSEETMESLGAKKAEIDWILKNCDVVSIHAPSIPSTNHLINANSLKTMKKDAILINTARGTIVDEEALYAHMAKGNLKYACIDVYDPEPPKPDNPLFTLDRVIATPHLAGLAQNGRRRLGTFVAEQVRLFLDSKAFRGEVTREMIDKMA